MSGLKSIVQKRGDLFLNLDLLLVLDLLMNGGEGTSDQASSLLTNRQQWFS